MCICIPRYPAWNEHAPCCQTWRARLYNIFPHYLINGTIFEKKIIKHKICFDFFYKFVRNISHYKKNWARHDQTYILLSSNGPASVNPGISTTNVPLSSEYLQRHPYYHTPTVTMGYSWIISRCLSTCIQSVLPLISIRGSILIISPKKTKGAGGWRALTVVALAMSE